MKKIILLLALFITSTVFAQLDPALMPDGITTPFVQLDSLSQTQIDAIDPLISNTRLLYNKTNNRLEWYNLDTTSWEALGDLSNYPTLDGTNNFSGINSFTANPSNFGLRAYTDLGLVGFDVYAGSASLSKAIRVTNDTGSSGANISSGAISGSTGNLYEGTNGGVVNYRVTYEGDVHGRFFYGDGSQLTNLPSGSSTEGVNSTGTEGSDNLITVVGDNTTNSAKITTNEANETVVIGGDSVNITVNNSDGVTVNGQAVFNEDINLGAGSEINLIDSHVSGLADATQPTHAVNKSQLDAAIAGVSGGSSTMTTTTFTPYSTITSTNGQDAIEELKDELDAAVIGVGTSAAPSKRTATGGETTWDVGTNITNSHKLFVNGVKLVEDTDYTVSGSVYTFTGYTSIAGHVQESFPDVAVPTTYDADEVTETATRVFVTPAEKALIGTGSSIDWQGAWVSGNYTVDQAVSYNGSSYINILNTVSNEVPTNSTYWDLMTEKGDTGADGADGTNGADGVVDGITLNNQFKASLEYQSGYTTKNYFNKNDIELGVIPNNTDATINTSATNHVSGKIWLSAGHYSLYNVSSDIYGYIQLYQEDGTYIRTERYFSNDLYFDWDMPQDGYVIMDVDNKVTTPLDQIMLSDYDLMFDLTSNIEMHGTYADYAPYNKRSSPEIVYEATDNLNDAYKWINPTVADAYTTDWYIDIETNGEKYISAYDFLELQSFNNSARPQIIEFDNTDTEIATQTSNQGIIAADADAGKWKRWRLNDNTTKVRFAIPFGNTVTYGTLTRQKLQDNFRINLGAYFTQEAYPYRVKKINDAYVDAKEGHKLKGKTIALFGDSITTDGGTIGSRSSVSIPWLRGLELTVFNYAEGSAGLTDWSDTTVVTDGTPTTVSHDNVVSNQIEEMKASGIIPDVVILTGGTNDVFRSRVKGTYATALSNYGTPASQDKETYYGMLFWAVKTLRDYAPNVQIFFMKPIKGVEEGDFTAINTNLITVWEAYDEVYKDLAVRLIDLKDLLPVDLETLANNPYYEDELHPSVLAKEKVMSPYILNEILKSNF